MKLWDKGYKITDQVESYTVGDDHILDQDLFSFDIEGTRAHTQMLSTIGILTKEEFSQISKTLDEGLSLFESGELKIQREDEDCHTAIEKFLVTKLGDLGKKIHTGRSRNDQVLTALRLYEKEKLDEIKELTKKLYKTIESKSSTFKDIPMAGYTHMRKAMPTNIETWLNSFRDALKDDKKLVKETKEIIDQSPLGSAAGFGVKNIDLDIEFSAKALKFKKAMKNPMYAQISRGKFESSIMAACSQIMATLNKLSTDIITFSMSEFSYIKLPKEFCTGSSIMPQKLNPDVLELMRAKYHEVIGEEFKVKSMYGNLISGYHRDLQLTKKPLMNVINITISSLLIMEEFIQVIDVDRDSCEKAMTEELFATEMAYELVKSGMPFREAYKEVGKKFVK